VRPDAPLRRNFPVVGFCPAARPDPFKAAIDHFKKQKSGWSGAGPALGRRADASGLPGNQ
jgi:hypothetical protein